VELRLLRYFVAIAEEGSFTAAAVRLRVAQPSLSEQIQRLERRLAATLVDRSAHPLRLTPAGEQLLAGAYRVLRAADEAEHAVRLVSAGRAGLLRVGLVRGGLYDLLLPVLRAMRQAAPSAEFPVRELRSGEQLAAVRRGEVDVALYRRTHADGLDGLCTRHIREDEMVAALPAGHPAGRSGRVRLADLAGERFATFPRSTMPLVYDRCLQACRDAGFEPRLLSETEGPLALALAVASGGGVALTGAGTASRYPGVQYLPVDPPLSTAEIAAVWHPGCSSPLLQPFLAHVTAVPTDPLVFWRNAATASLAPP
jgi:LysR family transcriptional regulator, benzoate and cis,cis-muconate-responsive activator of ben and cat genes